MTKQCAGSASSVRCAGFQQRLIVALCGVVFAALVAQHSPAQVVNFSDFNGPAVTPSQVSMACTSNSASSGVLFCLNYNASINGNVGPSFVQDFFPPSVDPNASSDGNSGSTNYALQVTENAQSQDSSVWYAIPQDVVDGFTVWYTFKITNTNYPPGDGLAFVIQNAAGSTGSDPDPYLSITNSVESGSGLTVLGAAGGGSLGYGGIDNSIALEADTFPDSYDPWDGGVGDYYDNHMALQSCGLDGGGNPIQNSPAHYLSNTVSPLVTTSCLVPLNGPNGVGAIASNPPASSGSGAVTVRDGNPHQVVVVYNGPGDSPANYLYVYLDPAFNPGTHTPAAGSTPLFSGPFNISQYMNLSGPSKNSAYLGFTAATGEGSEQHEIMGFSFTSHGASANVCPPGATAPAPCSTTIPVPFNFTNPVNVDSVSVVTQGYTTLDFQQASGSTCGGAYSAGGSCVVNVTFAPQAAGLRLGAVVLSVNETPGEVVTQPISGIGEAPVAALSPIPPTAIYGGSGSLNNPTGVAVDAAGNVFIADTANSRVLEYLPATGTTQNVGSGFSSPEGVAVDGAGDVFVADSQAGGNGEVIEVPAPAEGGAQSVVYTTPGPPAGPVSVAVDGAGDVFFADNPNGVFKIPFGGSATQIYSPSNQSVPTGVAVDAAGDLFISDSGLKQVVEIPAGCISGDSCQNAIGTGWSQPEGLTADAAGDVYVADPGLNGIVEVPAGCTSSLCQMMVVSGVTTYGVALDAQGDIYFADYVGGYLNESPQQGLALTFPTLDVGTASTSQSVILQDIGNQALSANGLGLYINDPYANPNPDFAQVPGPGTPADCTSAFSLLPGAACDLSVGFGPQSGGAIQAVAQFFDNALNNPLSSQSVGLSGTGVSTTPEYPLSVNDAGSGSGMVQSGDGLIQCSSGSSNECSTSYQSGTVVMLTAAANAGSTFAGWGGACAGSGTSATCNVPVNAATNVTATFSQQTFGSVSVCAGGSATGCTPSNLAVTFNIAEDTTIGAIQVVTQGITGLDFTLGSGSTCTGAIAAGNSCNVNVSFTPLAPGLRMGAVELFDNSGNPVANAPVYGVGQGPESAFTPGTQTTLPASGLVGASGVAVDAAGDVFISDNAGAVKITPSGVESAVPTTGVSSAYDVALDGAGDVYLADSYNNRVVEVTPGGVQTTVPATGLAFPTGVAVDGAGNLFITDRDHNQVVKVSPGGVQTTVPTSGVIRPFYPAVDGAGDVYFLDSGNERVLEVTPGGVQSTIPTSGLVEGNGVAVDAAGDVFVTDQTENVVLEVTPSGVTTTVPTTGLNIPAGLAVDGAGNVFIAVNGQSRAVEVNRSQPSSLSFALTNEGSASADSPQTIGLQNIGNLPLTFSLSPISDGNFVESPAPTCGSGTLAPGVICAEGFSFTPQATGYLTDTAFFSDNTLNLASSVVAQAVNMNGVGNIAGQAATVIVPNVVGMAQSPATTALTGAGLALGSLSSSYSSGEPAGSVIGENPAAGEQVTPGSPVKLLISIGEAPPPQPNPLTFENNYFVTGDYASAGVTLRGAPIVGGMATGSISIPSGTGAGSVPDGADIIDAFLYWQTVENAMAPPANTGTFLGYSITGQQIGSDLPYTDTATGLSGVLRAYRADVNAYFPIGANGVRFASGSLPVTFPDGNTALPLTQGASLVVIYRVLVAPGSTNPPSLPLKAVVIYDGSATPATSTTQNIQGFYDAVGGASGSGESTALYSAGTNWSNNSGSIALGQSNQYTAPLNAGSAYVAEIISTRVNNSDNDGILNAWKAGPPAGDFFAGQPGYYDVKTQSWVPLPGAKSGEKDLFVQLDWMCGGVDPVTGACTGENLFPSPDSNGNDPLAMVQQAFLATGIHLHLEIGNIVPEDTCTDSASQLCQFPGQPGVIGWKNSLEFSKIWPRNFNSCASGGDCTARFPYGQKDSYHYVLMGHSLTIPAWNTRFGTLTGIQVVAGGTTTITTTGIPTCPSRITIGGVLGNPGINGVYNITGCTATTMTVATPSGVPSWTYPNTLAEPVIGVTSGTVTSISGYSDLGGADSAVTLALWETAPNQDMSKRANVVAGTLYHEIGHTLGLSHGGIYYSPGSYIPTFDVNCKPNYQSVMNYLFQLDGVGPNGAVAYSNQTLESISEASLSSLTQLTDTSIPSNPATFPTSAWYSTVAPSSTASPATRHCDGTPLGSDSGYRVDGSIAPITPSWSAAVDPNIAFDGVPYTTLAGYNDVSNIDLRQVGATGGEFASLAGVLSFGSSATPLNVAAGGNVTLGAGGTVALGSGGTVTLGSGGNVTLGSGGTITPGSGGSVMLNNGGTATLSSGGTITLGSGGTVTLGSGGNVTLGSSGTITLGSGGNITLGSGGTVVLGSGGTITSDAGMVTIPSTGGSYTIDGNGGTIALGSGGTIALGSGGNVTLGSGGTIALGSGGNVTLGSGGTVTLGSGGTIALGSGGTIALGSGGNVTLGSGGTIALGSGGNVTLGSGGNVTLGSGGNVTLGSGGNVTLGSGGNVTLGSGGTVALGSGGNVTLGSGGNVTLGSGGTIALGSGGTVTLGSGGNITLGSGGGMINGVSEPAGTYTVASGGVIALGSGGTVALGSGGNVTLGSGGTITMGSGGTVTLGSGGNVTLGSGGVVALGSGGTIALGSGGTIALGSGGNVTLGSGGVTTDEMNYDTANSFVRPPPSASYTQAPTSVTVNWMAPSFGVVQTYTIYRSVVDSDGNVLVASTVIGSVSGVNGNPPATTFTDTNPPQTGTLVYTIATTLVPDTNGAQRQSAPSPPAMLTMNQNIVLGSLPSSVVLPGPQTVTATAVTNNMANYLPVSFSATGACSIGSQSPPDSNGVSSASVTLSSTGSCNITASQAGTSDYNSASSVSGTFTILAANSTTKSQTITFAPLQAVQYGGTFSLSASSSAQLPVSFTASGPCTTSGAATGVGLCTITASAPASAQGANPSYSAASVSQSFNILPATLTVTASSLTTTYGHMLPQLTYMYGGFVNNGLGQLDTAAVISGTPALSTTANSASNVGPYPIKVSTGTLAAANYTFLFVPGTLTVGQASQSITFTMNAPASAAFNSNFTVAASASSNSAVTYGSSGACTNTGATYTMIGSTGTCLVTASQAGTINYSAATPVTQTVNATGPGITVSPSSINFGSVTVGSVTIKTVTVSNTGSTATSISTPLLSLLQAGSSNEYVIVNLCPSSLASGKSCTITVSFVAGAYYNTPQTATLKVMDNAPGSPQLVALTAIVLESQTITFTSNPPASAVYNGSFTVAAKASSGLAVAYSSSGACTNSGANPATYTMTSGAGTCSVTASQAGNSTYAAATNVTKSVTATLATQAITFTTNPPSSAPYKSSFTVVASASSGLAVAYNSSGSCSNSGATYTMTSSTGTCSVIANQAGNSNYSAAPKVTKSVTATVAAQTITFTTNPPASAAYKTSFTVAATASSGLAVSFTSSGSCSNSGATYTMTSGSGTCSVIAKQAGNSSYSAAPQITKTVSATYSAASLTPTSLGFGTVTSGKNSTAQPAILKNTGTTPLIIGSIGFTGSNPSNFTQTNTCPSSSSSLAAGASCTISVTFKSGGKAVTASLTVSDNTQAGSQSVSLSGN